MNRRNFFGKAIPAGFAVGAIATSCAPKTQQLYPDKHFYINRGYHQIPKLRLSMDRIVKETVGLRPFRPSGPRLDVEQVGNKTIVHNYGHGGSGWSLSWGTGNIARNNVMATGEKKLPCWDAVQLGLLLRVYYRKADVMLRFIPKMFRRILPATWQQGPGLRLPGFVM